MIKTILTNPSNSKALAVTQGFDGKCTFVVESLTRLNSCWTTGVNDAAETIDIVTPKPDESIMITDIIITSSKKVASSNIVVQFYDGTNTVIGLEIEAASAPVQFSHAFVGGLKGWKDAILQIVTDQAAMNVTTVVSYIKISEALTKTYSEWNAEK